LANVAAVTSANVIDHIAKKLGLEVVDVRGAFKQSAYQHRCERGSFGVDQYIIRAEERPCAGRTI